MFINLGQIFVKTNINLMVVKLSNLNKNVGRRFILNHMVYVYLLANLLLVRELGSQLT